MALNTACTKSSCSAHGLEHGLHSKGSPQSSCALHRSMPFQNCAMLALFQSCPCFVPLFPRAPRCSSNSASALFVARLGLDHDHAVVLHALAQRRPHHGSRQHLTVNFSNAGHGPWHALPKLCHASCTSKLPIVCCPHGCAMLAISNIRLPTPMSS